MQRRIIAKVGKRNQCTWFVTGGAIVFRAPFKQLLGSVMPNFNLNCQIVENPSQSVVIVGYFINLHRRTQVFLRAFAVADRISQVAKMMLSIRYQHAFVSVFSKMQTLLQHTPPSLKLGKSPVCNADLRSDLGDEQWIGKHGGGSLRLL